MFNNNAILAQLKKFTGNYEVHISVNSDMPLNLFYKVCESFNAKAIVINLNKGITKIQPMLCKRLKGSPEYVFSEIKTMYETLAKDFSVCRIKIEADVKNNSIPLLDKEAEKMPSYCYFENHLRLNLDKNIDLLDLSIELNKFGGYLSKNSISKTKKGQNRFVTQRFYKLGFETAKSKFDEMCNFVSSKNISYDKKICEYNIYDSNSKLDDGWMNE